jgi:hypothetical protein
MLVAGGRVVGRLPRLLASGFVLIGRFSHGDAFKGIKTQKSIADPSGEPRSPAAGITANIAYPVQNTRFPLQILEKRSHMLGPGDSPLKQ